MYLHEPFIRQCLSLAERGRGKVGNGALVGAVLVRDGKVIGEGWHDSYGADHAEVDLIKKFDQQFQQQDTLYVNLEPCCHTGKTPPCTDRIIASGIRRVGFGMLDPDLRVAGKGIAALRGAGIEVLGPILPERCRRFNKGFVSVRENGRPYITLKQARSQDGSTANSDGTPKKITSREQDIWSHTWLRARHDAILVGIGTVMSDDPELTMRLMNKKVDQYFPQPYKIILDKDCQTPITSNVISVNPERTIIITDAANKSAHPWKGALEKLGVQVFTVPVVNNVFDWTSLWQSLTGNNAPYSSKPIAQSFHGITSILVEGGASTWNHFHRDGMLDEEVILIGA